MGNLTADEVITQKHKRAFIQLGGARPGNPLKYYGQDAQYFSITGVGNPETGIDPIFVRDPVTDRFRLIGRKVSPPDLAKATLTLYERHGSIPRQLGRIGCPFNLYELTGACADLSDFTRGWTDYVLIYSGALVTDKDLGDRLGFDSDDAIADALSLVLADIYPIGSLSFGDNAATAIDLEVIDVVYGSKQQCANCGPEDDGTKRAYAVVKSSGGSPGLPAEVIYTVDGGANWSQTNITGMGAAEDPIAIDVAGRYLLVLSRTAGSATSGGYYISEIDPVTGIPGAWTKVIAGFVASKQPNDVTVCNPREIYFCADGGYVYKSVDVTAGVTVLSAGVATTQNLYRIKAVEEVIVAAGVAGAVIRSANRGASFAALTAPSGAAIRALEVLDKNRIWVGTDTGFLYSTINGGTTWMESIPSGFESGAVYDIVFATEEVGYVAHATSTPTARVFATWDGGQSWTKETPRILNFPTANKINRIAVPNRGSDAIIAANRLIAGGLAANGTDGVLLLGAAPIM